MSEKLKDEGRKMAAYWTSAPSDAVKELHRRAIEQSEAEHAKFKEHYDKGACYLCGNDLTSFDESNPCVHWLLNPTGFRKKKHFPLVTEKFGFHQLQSFLRWLANEDGMGRNINDLPEEGSGKLREVTIRYKDLEWSFSCTVSDFNGHGSGTHKLPHYHFQMRKGPSTIIRFNDFHVPFSDNDIREISAEMSDPRIRRRWSHGEGMNEMFKPDIIETLIDKGEFETTGDGAGDIKFDYIIKADEGTTMKGEDIAAMIEEARTANVPLARLLKQGRLPNVSVRTIVTPGPGVVEQATRSGRGGKSPSNDQDIEGT